MAVIGSLSVKLGLVTVEWDQATAKAKSQAKDLQKSLDDLGGNVKTLMGHWKTLGGAMSLSAVGMGALLQQTLQFADAISDLAKGFDLTVAKTLQFRDAIKQSGGNAEGASKILSTLFSKIEDARSGNESVISQFERIGISFEELSRMKPDEALNRVFNALSKIGDTYQRVKAVKDLLGKQGIGLEISEVASRLNMSTAAYNQYANSIEKVGKVNDNLAQSFDNMKIAFADMIAPLTRDGVVSIEKFKAAMVGLTAATVVGGLIQIVTLSAKLIQIWQTGAKVQAAMTALGGFKGIIQLGAATAAYFAAKRAFELDTEAAMAEEPDSSKGGSSETDSKAELANRREITAGAAKIAMIRKQIELAKEEGDIKLKGLDIDKYQTQLLENDLNLAREIASAKNERAQALKKENLSQAQMGQIEQEYIAKRDLADAKANANHQLILATREREIKQIERMTQFAKEAELFEKRRIDLESERVYMTEFEYKMANERLSTEKKIADLEQQKIDAKARLGAGKTNDAEQKRLNDAIEGEKQISAVRQESLVAEEYRRTNFTEGWSAAFRKYAEDAQAYGKLGADMFSSVVGNMNSAIDNFVRTGKLSFKSFARSIIQDIIAMMLKFQAMQLLMSGMKALGLGGSPLMTGVVSMMGLPQRANGGSIDGPAIVGERGPELFIPKQSGTIVPNNKMASAMGNSQTVNNYTINAIDTKSFEQRLLESPTAIWAANQYANKSLAVNRGRA
jgi:lambda family phage tail tape measure protein